MHANDTNRGGGRVIFPELSYALVGICFNVHNDLGRYAREKQYGDEIERGLRRAGLAYSRELAVGDTGNIMDFLIQDKIALEIKAKRSIAREDYFQVQRYLQASGAKLGILVNFRDHHLKPLRVVRIDTKMKTRFV